MKDFMKKNDVQSVDKNTLIQECAGRLTPEEVENELQKLIEDGIAQSTRTSPTNENIISLTDQQDGMSQEPITSRDGGPAGADPLDAAKANAD